LWCPQAVAVDWGCGLGFGRAQGLVTEGAPDDEPEEGTVRTIQECQMR
jgi:hypothetical protein